MEIAPAARLMIERVVLENFKSYAGVHQIGPFHKNFTAVVGPNGSGKSNLLECLLFAFGKRATKMRLKKLSELIHHSKAHASFSQASVTVHFHDIIDRGFADYEVVAGSQFRLSRTVFRSGQTKYEVDGRESSYEEVTKLLKQRGIDLEHNRFLILQGEVEQIALMKPKGTQDDEGKPVTSGLLDYLEEIIGTSAYVQQIQDAEKSIEDAHEGLAQRQNNVNQSREALGALEGPKSDAVASLVLEQEVYQLRNLQHHMSRFRHNRAALELETGERKLLQEKEAAERLFQEKKEQNSSVIQAFARMNNLLQEAKAQVQALGAEYNKLEVEHTEKETAQRLCEDRATKLKADIEKQEARIRSLVDGAQEATAELPNRERELQATAEALEGVLARFQEMSLEVMRKTNDLQQQRNKLLETLRPVQAQHDSTQSKLTEIQGKADRLLHDREEALKLRCDLEQQIQSATDRKVALENELRFLQKSVSDSNLQREEFKSASGKAKQALEQLTAAVGEVQLKKQNFEKTIAKQQSANKLDRDISLAVKSGKLQGVRGRLGDLGAVPAAFDVAVSSAVNKLDNYVVETVDSADALLAFAREHKLGRITAIVLDKLRDYEQRCRKEFTAPRGASRVFDSIQYDQPDLAPAFYSAFGDMLIAKSLQEARSIAYEGKTRHKVVTVTGDIINPSGDMQGFAEPKRGKMRLIGQAEDVDMEANDFDGQIGKLEAAKHAAGEQLRELQDDYTRLLRQSEDEKARLKAVEGDLSQWEARLVALQRDYKAMEVPDSEEELAALKAPLQKYGALLEKIAKALGTHKTHIESVSQQIDAAGGAEFQRLKSEKKTGESRLMELEEVVQTLKTRIIQGKKDMEKASEHLKDLEGKSGRTQREGEALRGEMEQMVESARMIAERMEEVNRKETEIAGEIETMKGQQTALKDEFARLADRRTAIKTQLKELKTERKKNDEEMEAWNARIQANRGRHQQLVSEFGDLLVAPPPAEDVTQDSKRRHKDNYSDEKRELLFPIDKEFTWNEMEAMQSREELLHRLVTFLEEKVAQPDLQVIKEYREAMHRLNANQMQLEATRGEVEALRLTCAEIKRKRYDEFSEGFLLISKKLREMYQMLTRGGDAELEYADSTDPFAEGIVFTVRPPKKSWKKMANLSGGEKTLSSLALVFALHHYKPTALYVMDEVDAALDFQNVSIIANYIKSRTRDAQFIIVSLRYQNFELADRLVGVYKTNDVSKTLCISPAVLSETSSNAIIRQTVDNIRRTQGASTQAVQSQA